MFGLPARRPNPRRAIKLLDPWWQPVVWILIGSVATMAGFFIGIFMIMQRPPQVITMTIASPTPPACVAPVATPAPTPTPTPPKKG